MIMMLMKKYNRSVETNDNVNTGNKDAMYDSN